MSRYIRRRNPQLVGDATDLHEFLFGSERAPLTTVRPVLLDLQDGHCFYCPRVLTASNTHVDHFISWARYPIRSRPQLRSCGQQVQRGKAGPPTGQSASRGLDAAERQVRESDRGWPKEGGLHVRPHCIPPGCSMGLRADGCGEGIDVAAGRCDEAAGSGMAGVLHGVTHAFACVIWRRNPTSSLTSACIVDVVGLLKWTFV
jgi:hypothetical protein